MTEILELTDGQLAEVASYRELYYRWEHQQWSVGDIDFSEDRRQWRDELDPELRRALLWALAPFHVSEDQVTNALVPFVDAAPTEEQQVVLTTQLVDEARHAVFFDRFYSEVVGSKKSDMRARVEAQLPQLNDGFRRVVIELLPEISRNVKEHRASCSFDVRSRRERTRAAPRRSEGPRDRRTRVMHLELLVQGVILYHLVMEGTLGLTLQRFLLNFMSEAALLPGFREGFAAVARDAARHVTFAVAFLKEMTSADVRYGDVITKQLDELLPIARSAFQPRSGDTTLFDPLPFDATDLTKSAMESLTARLNTIGIGEAGD